MKCFIIIATGTPDFGQMALSACLSIKANNPKCKVILIHTLSAIKGNEERVSKYFDLVKDVHSEESPVKMAHWFKLQAYNLALVEGVTEAIILDADTVFIPGSDPLKLFEQKEETYFLPYVCDKYDFYQKKSKRSFKSQYWCNPDKANEVFGLDEQSQHMPSLNASFIYFKVCDQAKRVFDFALEIWNDTTFKDFTHYKESKTEELCFNIACAYCQVPLPDIYRPIYLQISAGFANEAYVAHHYPAFSLAADINHAHLDWYNRLADYYRAHFGIVNKFNLVKSAPSNADKTVFVPRKKENFIATIFLIGSKDKWNGFTDDANINKIGNWMWSLKDTGVTGIVFHNCFSKQQIDYFSDYPVKFSYVEMPSGHNSGLFRFELYNDFMQKYSKFIDGIFFTDSTDLEVLKNPFASKQFDRIKIYVGSEPHTKDYTNLQWLAKGVHDYFELLPNPRFAKSILFNAGLCGGSAKAVAPFIKRMAEECGKYKNNAAFQDMPLINILAYKEFADKVNYGYHVNTVFSKFERNDFSWFRHK